tara:strand:- start:536 stop:1015 length:480 start_codon:yes stop_codon:yes gene_type:complete
MNLNSEMMKLCKLLKKNNMPLPPTIYKEPEGFKSYDNSDAHCWIEVNDKKMDYTEENLRLCSPFIDNECLGLNYIPFPSKYQDRLMSYWLDETDEFLNQFNDIDGERYIMLKKNGYCFYRAVILSARLTERKIKHKVVFGSLGFKMSKERGGDYHYEYG